MRLVLLRFKSRHNLQDLSFLLLLSEAVNVGKEAVDREKVGEEGEDGEEEEGEEEDAGWDVDPGLSLQFSELLPLHTFLV